LFAWVEWSSRMVALARGTCLFTTHAFWYQGFTCGHSLFSLVGGVSRVGGRSVGGRSQSERYKWFLFGYVGNLSGSAGDPWSPNPSRTHILG